MTDKRALALTMRNVRRMAELSQEELARKSGIGVKSISSWETGVRNVRVLDLLVIAAVCDISIQTFFDQFETLVREGAA